MKFLTHPGTMFCVGILIGIMVAGKAKSLPVLDKLPSVG